MTKEQAIAILENVKYELSNQVASKHCRAKYEATEMAIEALEQPTEEISKELKKRVFYEIVVPKEIVAKELGCKTQWDCIKWLWTLDILQNHGFAICRTEGFLDD